MRQQAWRDAYVSLSAATATATLAPADLELLATAAYLVGADEASRTAWAQAHAAHLRAPDLPRAARCAFWLALDLFNCGELAQANGWVARARRLLDEARCDCPEQGLLCVLAARDRARAGDLAAAATEAERAARIASRFADAELRAFASLVQAQIMIRNEDAVSVGARFDEIMVAVTMGEVSPVGRGTVYCAVIEACHHTLDLARAREWTAALSRWCHEQPDLLAFRGQCLVHRAEVLRVGGDWTGALTEAEQACALLDRGGDAGATASARPAAGNRLLGAAWYELGEIRRLRGELEEARTAYREASQHGQAVLPGLALLHLAEGRLDLAEAAIRQALGEHYPPARRAQVLAAAVSIMIAIGDLAEAKAALAELAERAAEVPSPYLRALAADNAGSVLLAEGDGQAAVASLRGAWTAWQELDAPYHAARVRLLLGQAFRQLGNAEAAELELQAARRVFHRLHAAPDLEQVTRLLRAREATVDSPLSAREREVLLLLATGITNRAIATELGIAERTVDRHVSNIFLKLRVSSRTAATAYAFRHGLVRTKR